MVRNLKVLISQNILLREDRNEYLDTIDTNWYDFITDNINQDIELCLFPNHRILAKKVLSKFKPDLIILTGGNDLGLFLNREQSEEDLLHYAIHNSTPLIGVCRGFQKVNVFLGGGITKSKAHVGTVHTLVNEDLEFSVNSYHENVIHSSDLSNDLEEIFVHSDGSIEAARHKYLPWLLIMWHPERPGCCCDGKIWLKSYLAEELLCQ